MGKKRNGTNKKTMAILYHGKPFSYPGYGYGVKEKGAKFTVLCYYGKMTKKTRISFSYSEASIRK
jgi:hypothetical protein